MTSFVIGTVGIQGKVGTDVRLGDPTDGNPNDGLIVLDPAASVTDTIDALNEAIVVALLDRVGWTRVVDVTVPGGTATDKTYDDPPNNTILETVTVSNGTFNVIVESSYPTIKVNGNGEVLPLVGTIYRGSVSVTLGVDGPVVVETFDPDGNPGAEDTITVAISLPPSVTTAVFSGGYPGSQTELKQGDSFQLDVVADKLFDRVTLGDFGASGGQSFVVASTLSTSVSITIADRGDAAQLLPGRVSVRDAVTGAESATHDTDTTGSVDGVNLLNLNDLHPTVSFGAEVYPGAQGALKGSESATVAATQSDFDTILYDDNGIGHLSITNPTTPEATKTVTRIGGTYNVEGDGGVANLRATANRAANDADTAVPATINIANVAATITVSEATARVRSGVSPGSNTTITISADQELLNAPSMDPAASRGSFIGSWSGGPKTWNRSLQVPDSENPATGAANTWINLLATNLANTPTAVISGDDTYVVGAFTTRTVNYPPGTANSTETFPLTDETKLSGGQFSNGNPAVVQPFGTPDTTDPDKVGWCAPTAASGVAVQMRMLHSPTVAANATGMTLTLVEETV